ncbi:MAG: hypothetical protein F4X66_04795 [Chloroflexi bacterium]|nr:hypothetical protein [Chloroflexota bacterium]MYE40387.1 hypothetical protein [Chloroflexota bacterium]
MGNTGVAKAWWHLGLIAACVLLAAFLSACSGNSDAATSEKVLTLEAKVHSLEESLEALQEENATLQWELIDLRQRQVDYFRDQEAAKIADRIEREAATDLDTSQEQQLAALEEGQARNNRRFDDLDSRLRELEKIASQLELVLPAIEKWFTGMDKRVKLLEGTDVERTVNLAESAGGEVYYIDHPDRKEPAVLVMPLEPIEGNPLIVSLHGFGGNSADHALYVPFHEQVLDEGFGLILPNGIRNEDGQRFWNPTDPGASSGKASQDDYTYLSHIIIEAQMLKDFGPVYLFGYSNGGFMAYHIACKGLPGLRAVASLAGTSYVDDTDCESAVPVSVLHIHGTDDAVVLFDGVEGEPGAEGRDGPGYAGAEDMFHRWGARAGCNVQSVAYGLGVDLDDDIEGPETLTYAFPVGCAEGITVELWAGQGSTHGPGYGDAFTDALLDWLLAQE